MLSLRIALLAVGAAVAPVTPALAQAVEPRHIVALDFVKAKPGELSRLIRFFELNWSVARATVLAQRAGVVSYRMLVGADTASTWDVMLETVYTDSATYARRETIFQPVLAAKGKVLIDGKDRPAMGDIVASRVLGVRVTAPAK